MSIKITRDSRNKLAEGYRRFYVQSVSKPTLREAYVLTLMHFFTIGFEMHNGEQTPIMPPADALPSYRQFLYYRKRLNNSQRVKA